MSGRKEIYRGMTKEECEAQYNLRARRPDFEATVMAGWIERSKSTRKRLKCKLDIAYGDTPREKLDIFYSDHDRAQCLVYIHGGYWQRGDKSIYSFLADPFVEAGVDCIIVGYELCPQIALPRMVDRLRAALVWIAKNSRACGLSMNGLSLVGHSAGGHLTEMMMATDWPQLDGNLPRTLINAAVPISPISDLEPIIHTSINDPVGLDYEGAIALSPIHRHPPLTNAQQLVVCGALETNEFHRQADIYAETYATVERRIERHTVADADHFDEITALGNPDHDFFERVLKLVTS